MKEMGKNWVGGGGGQSETWVKVQKCVQNSRFELKQYVKKTNEKAYVEKP